MIGWMLLNIVACFYMAICSVAAALLRVLQTGDYKDRLDL